MGALKSFAVVISLILILILLKGCAEEKFIPDSNDPRLPKYAEVGNMVGGVLVNRAAWKTHFFISEMGTNRSFYFTNYSNGDSITLTIEGNFTEGLAKDKILIFNINMKNLQLTNLDGVKDLKGKIITLNGQNNSAMLRDYFQALGTKEFIGEQLEN